MNKKKIAIFFIPYALLLHNHAAEIDLSTQTVLEQLEILAGQEQLPSIIYAYPCKSTSINYPDQSFAKPIEPSIDADCMEQEFETFHYKKSYIQTPLKTYRIFVCLEKQADGTICNQKADRFCYLKNHWVARHDTEEKIRKKCQCICGRKFPTPQGLKRHEQAHNKVAKKRKCNICQICFTRQLD